jgi:long-chain fatty acid transport protein
MKKGFFILLALSLVLGMGTTAMATNGYQLIGIGQLQKSMGGAVTAAPRDSMTAISNPAGMSRVGSRADFSMEAFMPTRSVDFNSMGGAMTEGGTDMYGIPAIGWTAPTHKEGLWFGGGMYGTSGLGVDYGQLRMMPGAGLDWMLSVPGGGPGWDCNGNPCNDVTFDGHSAIQFWKMAPTLALDVNDKLSLGFALNLDYQSIAITQKFRNVPFLDNPAAPSTVVQGDVIFDLGRPTSQMGFGFTLGGLYDINDMVTVGLMYSSKQSFSEAEFRVGSGDVAGYNGALGQAGIYKMDLNYPVQYALGVAVKPMDKLLVALDYKVINWSDTHDKVDFTGPAGSFNAAGNPTGSSNSTQLNFGWDDQTVIALGVVYAATEDLDLSAGFNKADAPIEANDVFNNLVLPATVETHYTLGADYKLGMHWGIGLTYMKAKSNELVGANDIPAGMVAATVFPSASSGIKIALEETSYGTQLSYRF